ncbi:MAG: CoB--CoM heterodisulfide reductase iron-sulfur subunit B family protein [Desulfobacterales bacterium]
MKYALFLGCNIPARVVQYETAARAVMRKLGVQLVDNRDFKCCGYPVRNLDRKAFLLSASENLARAEKLGLNIMALCKCCFGSLKEAQSFLKEDGDLQEEIKHALAQKGLQYEGKFEVKHFLSVLYHDVGLDEIKSNVSQSYSGLKIATHYGCHALRPSKVTGFDDPVAPSLFDKLVEVTGAQSIDYKGKLECCGAPVLGVNDDLSMDIMAKKLTNGKQAGADYLCAACPYCQLQFDHVQKMMMSRNGSEALASIVYPQLLGLCMWIDEDTLGIHMNQLDITEITSFLNQE